MQAYKLVKELSAWIRTKERHATVTDVSDDLEQVEAIRKKLMASRPTSKLMRFALLK